MKINGKDYSLPEGSTVAQLAAALNIPEKGTAIAVNNKIVLKQDWATTTLADSDNVTVISAAYGG